MIRLSSPLQHIRSHYTVVIVGSGYGGSIAASRLARAGQRVCVLERGRELVAGQLPRTVEEVVRECQIDAPFGEPPQTIAGSPNGLYQFHVDERMSMFVGCGLGGTSLVNANVVLRPDPRVFEDPRWPEPIRRDADGLLGEGFHQAEKMLGVAPFPVDLPLPPKGAALHEAGRRIGERVERVPLAVTFRDGMNHVGVPQKQCIQCGDCVSGCNFEAKNTLVMNYLPDARRHGAEIYTEVDARRVERSGERWVVHYRIVGSGLDKFDAPDLFVTADVVILAAGVLGTSGILLRSRTHGLPLSDQVGLHCSSNRNVLGFGFNAQPPVQGVGFGDRPEGETAPVGPIITSAVDMRNQPDVNDGLIIEEGAVPGAIAKGFLVGIMKSAALLGNPPDRDLLEAAQALERDAQSVFGGPYAGALAHTMTLLAMGHDDSPGRLIYEADKDRIRVDWPAGREDRARVPNETMTRLVHALSATYVPNPVWKALPAHPLIAVQPLGGCVLGENATQGAVNHKGQVFSGPEGDAVHESLYVLDGSIVPRSTGLNPLLTISALAERGVALLARDRGWSFTYDFPDGPHTSEPPPRPGIRFSEAMRGHYGHDIERGFAENERDGKARGAALEVFFRITGDDLAALLDEPSRPLGVVGSVRAPQLSSAPLVITCGSCMLFTPDPNSPRDRQIIYRFTMTAVDGRSFFVEGKKLLHDDPGPDLISDATTLFVTLHDGPDATGRPLGRGILHIGATDFAHSLATLQATGAHRTFDHAGAVLRFGKMFALNLIHPYVGAWDRLAGLFSS